MSQPVVSIICPSYNAQCFISKTIQSVLNQTFKDFEMIIVDDHSNDKTVEIVRQFADPRIKLIVKETNSGAASCRNLALREANGKYIAFLDADDLWTKDKLEKQIHFMESNKYSFSYSKYEEIDENDQPLGRIISGPKVITYRKFKHMDYVGCLTVMYERSIYPDLQIPETLLKNNDYAMWLLLSKKAKCYLLNENLGYYRRHVSGSISSGKKSKLFKHHMCLYKTLYGYSAFRAFFCALRNVCFYFYKRVKYVKKA